MSCRSLHARPIAKAEMQSGSVIGEIYLRYEIICKVGLMNYGSWCTFAPEPCHAALHIERKEERHFT